MKRESGESFETSLKTVSFPEITELHQRDPGSESEGGCDHREDIPSGLSVPGAVRKVWTNLY